MGRGLLRAGLLWPFGVALAGVAWSATRDDPPDEWHLCVLGTAGLLGVPAVVVGLARGSTRPWPAWVRWALAVAVGVPVALIPVYAAGVVFIVGILTVSERWRTW